MKWLDYLIMDWPGDNYCMQLLLGKTKTKTKTKQNNNNNKKTQVEDQCAAMIIKKNGKT